jgi:hypothetical protein
VPAFQGLMTFQGAAFQGADVSRARFQGRALTFQGRERFGHLPAFRADVSGRGAFQGLGVSRAAVFRAATSSGRPAFQDGVSRAFQGRVSSAAFRPRRRFRAADSGRMIPGP